MSSPPAYRPATVFGQGLGERRILFVDFKVYVVDSECSKAKHSTQLVIQHREHIREVTQPQCGKDKGYCQERVRRNASQDHRFHDELYLP